MNIVTVNGKTYNLPNGNVSVIGSIVYCNGKIVTDCDEFDAKKIKVYNDNGYQVYTVWSDDFIKNKEKIIKDFCKYVRNKR